MAEFFLKYETEGLWYGIFDILSSKGLKHGISTRLGGVSQAPYKSLNLGLKNPDRTENVIYNRRRFCEAVGVEWSKIVTAEQVHGDEIRVAEKMDIGRGAIDYSTAIPNTDALVTNISDLPLMLFFADCVPVLIFDPVQKVIGISHAGWKGTVAKIACKTINKMQSEFASCPEDCIVGVGPSIGPCCYEVDDCVINPLKAAFPNWRDLVSPKGDRWMFDLWAANKTQLAEVGVKPQNIIISGVCTSCNSDLFFSHRAENGATGRMGAVISL